MAGYTQANLEDLICELGEKKTKSILSNFSCPRNPDIAYFLKSKAIEFSKQGLASTYLVFVSYKKTPVLAGYYTISQKTINIKKSVLSRRLQHRIGKFGQYNADLKIYSTPALLIGQLGKNYTNGIDKQISGDTLLRMAFDRIKLIQRMSSGRVVYLECEDYDSLKEFYKRNGFQEFGSRLVGRDEEGRIKGKHLIQMLLYLSHT